MKTKIERIWSISLIVIGIATFILAGSSVIGIELPDIAVRIIVKPQIISGDFRR